MKKIRVLLSIVVLFLFGLATFSWYLFTPIRIEGSNIDLVLRRIPANSKNIEIYFSERLASQDKISSFIDFSIKDQFSFSSQGTTLQFIPNKPLKPGSKFSITLKKGFPFFLGKILETEKRYDFSVTENAEVTRISPQERTTRPNDPIIVGFSSQIAPLGKQNTALSYEECPLRISPRISGTCEWISSSVLRFTPYTRYQYGTRYTLEVISLSGLPNFQKKTSTLITQLPTITGSPYISPDLDGIHLSFSLPVKKESLEKSFKIISYPKSKDSSSPSLEKTQSGCFDSEEFKKPLSFTVKSGKEGEFILSLSDTKITELSDWKICSSGNFYSTEGNEVSGENSLFQVSAPDYINQIQVLRKDSSGEFTQIVGNLLRGSDPQLYNFYNYQNSTYQTAPIGLLPGFQIQYYTEQKILPVLEFVPVKGGDPISCISSYLPEDTTKLGIRCFAKTPLKPNTQYAFQERKENISRTYRTFTTGDQTKILSVSPRSAGYVCVRSNRPLDPIYDFQSGSYIQPQARLLELDRPSNYASIFRDGEMSNQPECPDSLAGTGEFLTTLRGFYQEKVQYNILSGSLYDIYGESVTLSGAISFIAPKAGPEYEYFSTSLSKSRNILPENAPIYVTLETKHLGSATVELCELDAPGFFRFSQCKSIEKKDVSFTNNGFTLTRKQIDISQLFGKSLEKLPRYFRLNISTKNTPRLQVIELLFARTNLSLVAEGGANKKMIFATNLLGNFIPKDLQFEGFIFDNNNKIQSIDLGAQFQTGSSNYSLKEFAPYILAKNANTQGVIVLDTDISSNYSLGYSGGFDTNISNMVYLHTDRPIYKVGDTVNFHAFIRKMTPKGFAVIDGKYHVKVVNDTDEILYKGDFTAQKNGTFSGSFALPQELALGRYRFSVFDDEGTYAIYSDSTFHVEAYRKPLFRSGVSTQSPSIIAGEKLSWKAEPTYYYGANLSDPKFSYTITSQNYYFLPQAYSEFLFGSSRQSWYCNWYNSCDYGDQFLDSKDEATQFVNLDSKDLGGKIVTATIRVLDNQTKQDVSGASSVIVHPSNAYVGIKAPNYTGKDIPVELITLSNSGEIRPQTPVVAELILDEWVSSKKVGVDGYAYDEGAWVSKIIEKKTIYTDTQGKWKGNFEAKKGGSYKIKTTYTGPNKTLQESQYDFYVSGEDAASNFTNGVRVDMQCDKPSYEPKSQANCFIQSPVSTGSITFSILRDNDILSTFIIPIQKRLQDFTLDIPDEYMPGVYVRAHLIGSEKNNPLPIYKQSLLWIPVHSQKKLLQVSVTPQRETARPGENLNVSILVRDNLGKPVPGAVGTLGVVDESLLALVGNPQKQPYQFFYGIQRFLGVNLYNSLTDLIDKIEVKFTGNGEKGGAGEGVKGGQTRKKRGDFRDTAYWTTQFSTNETGEAKILVPSLPDNMTTWVVEAVVGTQDSKFGAGRSTFTTKLPVFIQDNLPRFVSPGVSLLLSPSLVNETNAPISGELVFEFNGKEQKRISVTLSAKNTSVVDIPFQFPYGSYTHGRLAFDFIQSGKSIDAIEKVLPVKQSSQSLTFRSLGVASPLNSETLDISHLSPISQSVIIQAYNSPMSGVTLIQQTLSDFKYLCSEQLTSKIAGIVSEERTRKMLGFPRNLTKVEIQQNDGEEITRISLDTALRKYLARIPAYLGDDGGVRYWTDNYYWNSSDQRLTVFVLSTLAQISDLGYPLDKELQSRLINYLNQSIDANILTLLSKKDTQISDFEVQSLAHAVLGLSEIPSTSENAKRWARLLSEKFTEKNLGPIVLSRFAILNGDEEKAKKIIEPFIDDNFEETANGIVLATSNSFEDTRDTFRALLRFQKLQISDQENIVLKMHQGLLRFQKDLSLLSTSQARDILLATSEFVQFTGKKPAKGIEIVFDDQKKQSFTFAQDTPFDSKSFQTSFDSSRAHEIHFSTLSGQTVYYDVTVRAQIPFDKITARDAGYSVSTKYYDWNEYQKIQIAKEKEYNEYLQGKIPFEKLRYKNDPKTYLIPLQEWKRGNLVLALTELVTGIDHEHVAFTYSYPMQSEGVNFRLSTEGAQTSLTSEKSQNQDFQTSFMNYPFHREEYRNDEYFAYARYLSAGSYTIQTVLRPTHRGTLQLEGAKVFDFYNPEVLGTEKGRLLSVKE